MQVLYDIGVVSTKEPFQKLVNQGMILGEVEFTAYQDGDGKFATSGEEGGDLVAVKVPAEEVEKVGDG